MVRFSGKARKTNHIALFCERSEVWTKSLRLFKNTQLLLHKRFPYFIFF
ncbi:MAG: hypothetical protein U5L45_17080 [Saprospiraceae bacterium]|nr:hypothetical protein [Saprospiraceae bacterium]